jgi:hypothetical protein
MKKGKEESRCMKTYMSRQVNEMQGKETRQDAAIRKRG